MYSRRRLLWGGEASYHRSFTGLEIPKARSPPGAENIHPRERWSTEWRTLVKHHRKIGLTVMEGRTLEGRYVRVISAASDKDGSSMLR